MNTLLTVLITLFTLSANARTSSAPELRDVESRISKCDKAQGGYEITACLANNAVEVSEALKPLLNDNCRFSYWSRNVDALCGEKAQYEGQGTFHDRRIAYCVITQSLLLYGQLLEQQKGGKHYPDEKFLDLYNDPDSPQILPLQELRDKVLDKNSKELKCVQKPLV